MYTCCTGDDSAAESDASSLSDYDADPMDRFSVTALPGANPQQAAAAADREADAGGGTVGSAHGAQAQQSRALVDSRRSESASSLQQGLTQAELGSPLRRAPLSQEITVNKSIVICICTCLRLECASRHANLQHSCAVLQAMVRQHHRETELKWRAESELRSLKALFRSWHCVSHHMTTFLCCFSFVKQSSPLLSGQTDFFGIIKDWLQCLQEGSSRPLDILRTSGTFDRTDSASDLPPDGPTGELFKLWSWPLSCLAICLRACFAVRRSCLSTAHYMAQHAVMLGALNSSDHIDGFTSA